MSVRSVIIGFGLAMMLCAGAYYNDWVIVQRGLVGSLLPIGVIGVVLVGILLINPLLGLLRRRWMLRPGEWVVIVVMGLGVASFPGGAFSRLFSPMMVLPIHAIDVNPSWQAAHVSAYVPGGSAEVGEGHVKDFVSISRRLSDASMGSFPGSALAIMPDAAQRTVAEVAASGEVTQRQRQEILVGLNAVIRDPQLSAGPEAAALPLSAATRAMLEARQTLDQPALQMLNRRLLVAAMPDLIEPAPTGTGVLLLRERGDPSVIDAAVVGARPGERVGIADVPWSAWWPAIRLWGGLFLALTLASLCLVLIVHPQWSKRELLPYPLVQVTELMLRREAGRRLPDVAYTKLFWYGFGAMALIGVVNGLHAWFPDMPVYIPRRFDFSPLGELFPNASRVSGSWGLFRPFIYPTVIAFSFFLTSRVVLSLGLSMFLWTALAGVMVGRGVTMTTGEPASPATLLLFGGSIGFVGGILYAGRRHYWDVLRGALGARGLEQTPGYCIWAARLLVVCVGACVWLFHSAGLDARLGLLFTVLLLMIFLILTRINAETGAFILFVGWVPAAVLSALLGPAAIGPSAYIVLLLGSLIFVTDTNNPAMAQMANAICLADRFNAGVAGDRSPPRAAGLMSLVLLVGLPLAIAVVLLLHYNIGMNTSVGWWVRDERSVELFDRVAQMVTDLSATGQLHAAVATDGLERLSLIHAQPGAMVWIAVGLALVLLCLAASLRLPWWPLHPVLFVFWGTFPSIMLSVSFLIGWAIKVSVVKLGGAEAYRTVKPLMVGIIAGELIFGLVWMIVGAVYHFATGFPSPLGGIY